jgi:hypothetical protein
MVDVAGTAISAVALASLFTTCIECFEYVHFAKQFGDDYQKGLLKLDIVRLRLSRWGDSVQVQRDDGRPGWQFEIEADSQEKANVARHLLGQLINAFETAKVFSKRYEPQPVGASTAVFNDEQDLPPTLKSLHEKVQLLALQRQKKSSFVKKAKWALQDKNRFDTLIQQLTGFVDDLIDLFPGQAERQKMMCRDEIAKIQTRKELIALSEASRGTDLLLEGEAGSKLKVEYGSFYNDIKISEQSKVVLGDDIAARSQVAARTNTYSSLDIRGQSWVLAGNRIGFSGSILEGVPNNIQSGGERARE